MARKSSNKFFVLIVDSFVMDLSFAQQAMLADMADDLTHDACFSFRPGTEIFARVEAMAAKEKISRATVLRQLVREALKNHEVA